MGSDQIGNSVHPTSAYEQEKHKLFVSTTVDHTQDEPVVTHTEYDPELEEDSTDILGSPVLNLSHIDAATISAIHDGIQADPVDLVEFQEFKRQVIAAFKHLGLDTRKHFTD